MPTLREQQIAAAAVEDAIDAIAARRALSRGGSVEDAARAALEAIHRDAIERARPYVEALARFEAARPLVPIVIGFCGGCGQAIAVDSVLGSRCGCSAAAVAIDLAGDAIDLAQPGLTIDGVRGAGRYTAASRSTAQQTREALHAVFEEEPDATRRGFAMAIVKGMTDQQLDRLRRMLR
jgi:hypothetical protein